MRKLLLLLLLSLVFGAPAVSVRVGFYDAGSKFQSDQFSALLQELEARGNAVVLIKKTVSPDVLQGVDVLVIGDLEKSLSPQELAAILSFVHRGGGLFVCGEGEALNSFLPAFGILLDQHYLEALRESRLDERDARSFNVSVTPAPGLDELLAGVEKMFFLGAKGVVVLDPELAQPLLFATPQSVRAPYSEFKELAEGLTVPLAVLATDGGFVAYVSDCDAFLDTNLQKYKDYGNSRFFLLVIELVGAAKSNLERSRQELEAEKLRTASELSELNRSLAEVRAQLDGVTKPAGELSSKFLNLMVENMKLKAQVDPMFGVSYYLWGLTALLLGLLTFCVTWLRRRYAEITTKRIVEEEETLSAEELLERIGVEEKPEAKAEEKAKK